MEPSSCSATLPAHPDEVRRAGPPARWTWRRRAWGHREPLIIQLPRESANQSVTIRPRCLEPVRRLLALRVFQAKRDDALERGHLRNLRGASIRRTDDEEGG